MPNSLSNDSVIVALANMFLIVEIVDNSVPSLINMFVLITEKFLRISMGVLV